jgi:PBP1b-binding outer membrane lipoprotein LpoB
MKKIIYIILFLTIFQACSDSKVKSYKKDSVKEAVPTATTDNLKTEPLFEENLILKSDQISFQKIQQIVEISKIINDSTVDEALKNNSLNLAKKLYKNKEKQLIINELQQIDSQESDSIFVKNLKIIKTQTLDLFTQQTSYSFDIISYKDLKESIFQKKVVIEFKNIETDIEGKTYYSIKSKIVKLY